MNYKSIPLAVALLFAPASAQGAVSETERAVDAVVLIDRSQSLLRVDPDDLLTRGAARLIADSISATSALSGAPARLAVAEFGKELREIRSLSSLQSPVAIPSPSSRFDETDFFPALRYARRALSSSSPDARRLIFLITDGEPAVSSRNPSRDDEISAVGVDSVTALQGSGFELFLVAIRAPRPSAAAWRKVLLEDRYLPLNGESDFPRVGIQLLNELTGRRLSHELVAPGKAPFPHFAKRPTLLFVFGGSSQTQVNLINPQGRLCSPTLGAPDEAYSFFLIREDVPGPWHLLVQGDAAWVGAAEASAPPSEAASLAVPNALWIAGTGLILTGLSFLVGYWLGCRRGGQAQTEPSRPEPTQEVDLESVGREADRLVKQDRPHEAEGILSDALKTVFKGASGAILAGRDILWKILNGVYPNRPDEQRRVLLEQLHAQSMRESVQAVAQVLRERWEERPQLFFEEFYVFRDSPRGVLLVAELSRLSSEGSSIGHFLRDIATQTDRIQHWMNGS